MTNEDVVAALISALERKDLHTAVGFMTDDVEYDNVPMRKVFGHAGVVESLEPFFAGCDSIRWEVLHQAASGDVVMNERIDRFQIGGTWREVAVAGLFVLRDGKVALWRDYFDLAAASAAMS